MTVKSKNTAQPWVDADDAPELTAADFARGTWSVGGARVPVDQAKTEITRRLGRPPAAVVRTMISMRVDPDVAAALRASGKGWQTRVNALLRQAVEQGRLRA